jgi:hypothetical protein
MNLWPAIGVTLLIVAITMVINKFISPFAKPSMDDVILNHHVTARGMLIIAATSIIGGPVYTVLYAGLYMYFLASLAEFVGEFFRFRQSS